ncbi:MAG: universal stress protein [Thiobacillus sp.]|uniref:universal stress protein n=1 Tax=Thiobacillus sp. 63-78 TaxID=1895859 RepID=UPI001AC1DBD0|nr:universal stress protein [Thiobacillus sp. 63-78]MBN8773682.1 universal stress protein [Thiobacillus sp.]
MKRGVTRDMKQILVATDFSQYSNIALDRAVLLATEHQAALEVLHVITPASVDALCDFLPDSRQAIEENLTNSFYSQLYDFADRVKSRQSMTIQPRVRIAEIETGIIEAAAACDADLIVLGSHGEHSSDELFVGSTAENVLARETRPVLIAKQKADAPYGKIGVAVDLTERSAATIRKAGELAPNATTCLLHALQAPNHERLRQLGASDEHIKRSRSEFYDRAVREIGKLIADRQDERISRVVELDYPPAMIRRWTEKLHFDLIVMGKRGGRLGSVVRHVLHNSASDILVVG